MKNLKQLFVSMANVPSLFKLVWEIDKKYLFLVILEMTGFALAPYPALFLASYAINAMEKKTDFSKFAVVCLGFLTLSFIISVMRSYINNRARLMRGEILFGKINNQFHRKCMDIDYQSIAESKTQNDHAEAAQFLQWRFGGLIWGCISILSAIVSIIISNAVLTAISPLLIVIIIAGITLSTVVSTLFIPLYNKINKERTVNQRHIDYYNTVSLDYVSAKDIRIFSMEEAIKDKTWHFINKNFKLQVRQSALGLLQNLIGFVVSYGIDTIIYAILGYGVLQGNIEIAAFTLALGSIALFRQYFGEITETLLMYGGSERYMRHYIEFMKQKSRFREGVQDKLKIKKGDDYTIEFRGVSFRYPGQEGYALNDFSVKINSGEKISIIGENGAGKSTLIKLLCRLYDPDEGEILLNDVNIKDIDYDEYLEIFAPVFQDFQLFAFTLRENISSFDAIPDDEKLKLSVEMAGVDGVIENLPDKMDTYFTKQFDEYGVELSGGEQQKIAIARAHYKSGAFITILDEPTSSLDPRAEYQTYKRLNDLIGSNTALFISHRLSSSKFCDKIIVLKNGRLHEYGTHSSLMAINGEYAELFNMQAECFI